MVACSNFDEPKWQNNSFIKDIKESFEASLDDVIIESILSTVDGAWANGKKVKLTFSTYKKFQN